MDGIAARTTYFESTCLKSTDLASLEISALEIEGVRCALRDSGPADAPEAVVLLHGNPGPMDDWDFLLPAVSGFARVIAMDMPGFGRAARPRGFDYSVDGYARYLGALLDRLQVQRAHLVMHDFGGGWGLRWALEHPERVGSLTFINCGVLDGYRWHRYARIWQTPVLGELFQLASNAAALHAAMSHDNPRPLPRAFTERIARYADWGHKRAVLKLYRASRNVQAAFPEPSQRPDTSALPVCVVWGEGDPYVPAAYAHRQRETFPKAQVHVLPRLGHWPFIDDPQAVLSIVRGFLLDQIGGPAAG